MKIKIDKKTRKIVIITAIVIVGILLTQTLIQQVKNKAECEGEICDVENIVEAERIEIINFHSTLRCQSCTTMSTLINKTLESGFSKEMDSNRITFREINYELPENKEIAEKYSVKYSGIYINYIYNNKDHIAEDVNIWRFIWNEENFQKYLGDKLAQYL